MSKAEERANERYPLMQDGDEDGLEALKYVGMECGSIYEYNSIRYSQQAYFIEGYHQAEKDLELTWKDIPELLRICEGLKTSWWFRDNEQTKKIGTQIFWEEVLKRFRDFKEK